jgi:ubiquinone/menaquinone biosynthesis C-methylase UbiE
VSTPIQLAQNHWNNVPLYLSEKERYGAYPWLYRSAEFENHRGQDVLEVGCGTGCDLLQFARNGANATGVDVTQRHIDLAQKRVGDIANVQYGSACELPFPDGSFDYVYSHGVLHHIDEPDLAVQEVLRVLRPGGRFNIQVYARLSYFTLYRVLRYGRGWKLHIENSAEPVYIEFYTASKLRRLFRRYGVNAVIEKHHCKPLECLAPMLGFFLIAKGRKPQGQYLNDTIQRNEKTI